jgi:hypothetical protein
MKYIFVFTFLVFSATLSAQCRGFSKENCKDLLGNYVPTGENNNVKLSPGDRYQFISTFYEGQSYRIATCADTSLGNIQFTIRNSKRHLYYDNHGNDNRSFDFKVAATQQLVVSVIIPENSSEVTKSKKEEEGCVSALIGFKL